FLCPSCHLDSLTPPRSTLPPPGSPSAPLGNRWPTHVVPCLQLSFVPRPASRQHEGMRPLPIFHRLQFGAPLTSSAPHLQIRSSPLPEAVAIVGDMASPSSRPFVVPSRASVQTRSP